MPSSGSCLGMKSSNAKGSAGGFWLFCICDLSKTSRTKHTTVSRYLRFQQSPMFRTRTFFFNIFLAGLLRFDPCCMFVVSIIMDPDLIRIESYHSETLTLGATKTWAQLNHLNTSGYLIRILSADLPVVSSLSLCWAIRLFPDSLLCVCAWLW